MVLDRQDKRYRKDSTDYNPEKKTKLDRTHSAKTVPPILYDVVEEKIEEIKELERRNMQMIDNLREKRKNMEMITKAQNQEAQKFGK